MSKLIIIENEGISDHNLAPFCQNLEENTKEWSFIIPDYAFIVDSYEAQNNTPTYCFSTFETKTTKAPELKSLLPGTSIKICYRY